MSARWVECAPPAGQWRWHCLGQDQGQIVQVEYAHPAQCSDEPGRDAPYKRVTDQSEAVGSAGRVTYYRREVSS